MRRVILIFISSFLFFTAKGQTENSAVDVVDYREKDGKIIITLYLNGVKGDFVLDLAGHNVILFNNIEKYGIRKEWCDRSNIEKHQYKEVNFSGILKVDNITFGNNIFGNEVSFFVLDSEPYLESLGVVGIVNGLLFKKSVLTIDASRKKITTTIPFKPLYMKLTHRETFSAGPSNSVILNTTVGGSACDFVFDTWNSGLITLNEADFVKFSKSPARKSTNLTSVGYGKNEVACKEVQLDTLVFVKSEFSKNIAVENKSLTTSVIGLDLLNYGIISIDFMKNKVYFQPHGMVEINDNDLTVKPVVIEDGKLNPITSKYFKTDIFDYTKGGEFKSKSNKIIVIDFWATWCGPCMKLLPQMERLAAKYKGKVLFCKVNADKEKELCGVYNVIALPTLLFIPIDGKPIIEIGATPEKFEAIIDKMLLL